MSTFRSNPEWNYVIVLEDEGSSSKSANPKARCVYCDLEFSANARKERERKEMVFLLSSKFESEVKTQFSKLTAKS